MAIPTSAVEIGKSTKKSDYDILYNNSVLCNTGGTPGGAQSIPGDKTFEGDTTFSGTVTVKGDTTFSGTVSVQSTATFSGATTFSGTVSMESTATCLSDLTVGNDLTVGGNVAAVKGTFSGAISGTTIDTGAGAVECYAMNQAVRTTDSPTFSGVTAPKLLYSGSGKNILIGNTFASFYNNYTSLASGNYLANGYYGTKTITSAVKASNSISFSLSDGTSVTFTSTDTTVISIAGTVYI